MLLLAFDTATPAVTVALHDGRQVLAESVTVDARRQGELLATSVEKVLAEAGAVIGDVSVIVAGAGPGPYTGLRTGLVTARVFASVTGAASYGVCTLDVIARDAVATAGGREFLVATDARRRELYWGRYSGSGERLSGPAVSAPASLPAGLPAAGEGALLYPGTLGVPLSPRYPSAATMAIIAAERIAAGDPLPPAHPLYLRRPDAREPGRRKSVLASQARAGATPA